MLKIVLFLKRFVSLYVNIHAYSGECLVENHNFAA